MTPQLFLKARELAQQFRASAGASVPILSAAKKDDEGTLYVYAAIGDSWWGDGVTAKSVIAKLDELKGSKKLSVRINSEGGDVWEGKAIQNAIARFDVKEKTTYVDGLCASAATFIAMACPRVVTAANATWMIHETACLAAGRASDLRAMADVMDMENDTIASTYAKKTGLSVQACRDLMAAETWMNAATAKEKGFTDEVESTGEDAGEGGVEEPENHGDRVVAVATATQARIAAAADCARRTRLAELENEIKRASPQKRSGQPVRTTK